MLWEPDENSDFPMRSFGRRQTELEQRPRTAVIDGQQRLTALFLVLRGEVPLLFDLSRKAFTYTPSADTLRLDILRNPDGRFISFNEAASQMYFTRHASPAQQLAYGQALNVLSSLFLNRRIPCQTIKHAGYTTVLDVFKRLNQQGEPLNEAQLTLAGISRHWPGVFRRTYDLLKRLNEEMGFDQAEDPTFVFQVWTAVHTGQHLVKHLAPEAANSRYRKPNPAQAYEESWVRTEEGLSALMKVMRDELDLTNFRFIKAAYPLAVTAHFLATHPDASDEERDRLRRWLVLALTTGRYHERAQSKYGHDIRSTTFKSALANLFSHRLALDPAAAADRLVTPEVLLRAGFRSSYVTLLYLLARRLDARDWRVHDLRVGDSLSEGPWHLHHIFPDELFDAARGKLRNQLEDARVEADDEEEARVVREQAELEARIASLGNLAFLSPSTNIRISNRHPSDYLKELAATPEGRAALKAQLIPLEPELWKLEAFEGFRKRRCELIAEKARELFFAPTTVAAA